MRRKLTLLCIVILIPFSIWSQSPYRENDISYGGIESTKTYFLHGNKDFPSCNLKINFFFPEIYTNTDVLKKVQNLFVASFFGEEYASFPLKKAVIKYEDEYVKEYRDLYEKSGVFKDELKTALRHGEKLEDIQSFYFYEKMMRNTILLNRGNVISMVTNVYEYTGGAHGASSTTGIVIDLTNGEQIHYEDVFSENQKSEISDLILRHLKYSRNAVDFDELRELGFDFDFIEPTPNFVVVDKGIVFIYGQYELGSYSVGIVEVLVPFEEIMPYINPDSPIYRFSF
ncbi:DUF3298 and DUF4163 domain-containing protein [Bacteroidales bacterium OttesenSCG-928-I14]|nr:DUF3298 and DUF4163 domain-containing protein [Bacteroidales bacterium OttesenSCG-928-I14]